MTYDDEKIKIKRLLLRIEYFILAINNNNKKKRIGKLSLKL